MLLAGLFVLGLGALLIAWSGLANPGCGPNTFVSATDDALILLGGFLLAGIGASLVVAALKRGLTP